MSAKGVASEALTPAPTTAAPVSGGLPRLEKYELIEEIGHGGMATVYRARDLRLGREVAVKIIHRHLREHPEVSSRFLAEARAAAKLRHPGIVEVFDVSSEDDGDRFLVAELVRGATLRKILAQHPELPAEVGAAIIVALCDALEHAHASGVIHRDVKPENVLVELPQDRAPRGGRATSSLAPPSSRGAEGAASEPRRSASEGGVIIKITDFGIAKILDAQGVTSTGQVLGSPAHMAPEQIEGGEIDPSTDVFGLGVLFYECLVGHLPFEGKNPAQVLRRVLEGSFSPADRERPTVGARWAKIVARALAHDRKDRFERPGLFADAIRAELCALGLPNPEVVVDAYFADPARYREELTAELVPRLCQRGEKARRDGDVPGAAADYNRALALAPSNLAILKRLTKLNARAGRRRLAVRASAALGGVAVVAFVGAWVSRRDGARLEPLAPEPAVTVPGEQFRPPAPIAPLSEIRSSPRPPSPTTSETGRPRASVTPVAATGSALVHAGVNAANVKRRVRFAVNPQNARVVVEGRELGWNEVIALTPGPHPIRITVDSKCCKEMNTTANVTAPPPDKPEEEQVIPYRLLANPSTVSLSGAPELATVSCLGGTLVLSGSQAVTVTLQQAEWSGTCQFVAPDGTKKSRSVTLRAGEANVIAWR